MVFLTQVLIMFVILTNKNWLFSSVGKQNKIRATNNDSNSKGDYEVVDDDGDNDMDDNDDEGVADFDNSNSKSENKENSIRAIKSDNNNGDYNANQPILLRVGGCRPRWPTRWTSWPTE